jgi:hypothetical protein
MQNSKRIEKLQGIFKKHLLPRPGDMVRLVNEGDTLYQVLEVSMLGGAPLNFTLRHTGTFAQRTAKPDQVVYEPIKALGAILRDEAEREIEAGARDLQVSVPRILRRLEVKPEDATRAQYNDAADWLTYLNSTMKNRPLVGASEFIKDLRYAVELWLQAVVEHHFPEGK